MAITIESDPRDTQLRLYAERTARLRHLARRIDAALAESNGKFEGLREELRVTLMPNPQIQSDR